MAIKYEKLVTEDLEMGFGAVDRTMPAGGTAVGTKLGLHTWSSTYNVQDFGAVGDGITDDAALIQAAIDTCADNGGGVVYCPPGEYLISTTLEISTNDVYLKGAGGGARQTASSFPTPATSLKWVGAADGILLSASSISGTGNQGVRRIGVSDLCLDGNAGLAGYLLWVLSVRHGVFRNLTLNRPRLACLYTSVVSELADSNATAHCLFENLSINACNSFTDGTAHQFAQGMKLTGDTVANANTNYCEFRNIEVVHMKGPGVYLFKYVDSNRFYNVVTRCTDTVGSTVPGVWFDGDNVATPGNNRVVGNVFYNLSAQANSFGGGVTQDRVGTDDWNALVDYDIMQGIYLPIVNAGKMVWNSNGQSGIGFTGAAGISAIRREIGSLVVGTTALATTAVDGFLYIPTCAGTPTGTPTTWDAGKAVVYDTSANKLWIYNGSAWKFVALS